MNKPGEGFTAFFMELIYDSGGKYPFKFTTDVSVVPDVLPFSFKIVRGRVRSTGRVFAGPNSIVSLAGEHRPSHPVGIHWPVQQSSACGWD